MPFKRKSKAEQLARSASGQARAGCVGWPRLRHIPSSDVTTRSSWRASVRPGPSHRGLCTVTDTDEYDWLYDRSTKGQAFAPSCRIMGIAARRPDETKFICCPLSNGGRGCARAIPRRGDAAGWWRLFGIQTVMSRFHGWVRGHSQGAWEVLDAVQCGQHPRSA